MNRVFLGLGSNVGDRLSFIEEAIDMLRALSDFTVIETSSIYETEPVGYKKQNYYLNMAIHAAYSSPSLTLLNAVKSIERAMGRSIAAARWGPRVIDIDILFFGPEIVTTQELHIPHREVRNRRFVLEPLTEIAPDFRCPVSGYTISELNALCPDTGEVFLFKTENRLFTSIAKTEII